MKGVETTLHGVRSVRYSYDQYLDSPSAKSQQ